MRLSKNRNVYKQKIEMCLSKNKNAFKINESALKIPVEI
jgi:hypothetical protein